MKKAVILVALVLSALSLITVSAQAKVQPGVWAFLFADRETSEQFYMPKNKAGVTGEVRKTRTDGRYEVNLTGVGAAGVPMVTAHGEDGVHCQLASLGSNGRHYVDCYAGNARVNSKFMLAVFTAPASGSPGSAYGYVSSGAMTGSYPNDGTVGVVFDQGRGIWTVKFARADFAGDGGNVQVTTVGTLPARCAVVGWRGDSSGMTAEVKCTNLSGDATYRPQWTLVYSRERSIVGGDVENFGYIQAAPAEWPEWPKPHTPTDGRNRGPAGFMHSVTRPEAGRYEVQVRGPLADRFTAHVVANSSSGAYCKLASFAPAPAPETPATLRVSCFNSNGVVADSWFSVVYYSPVMT